MTRSYNPLGAVEINDLEIGLCPVCCRRLTAECGHVDSMEGQEWYAAFIAAEQMLRNDLFEPVDSDTHPKLDAGTHFGIVGGEIMELDSYLEARYDEQNGGDDLPF